MPDKFRGKVALVTGGNSGIGKATALAFAAEGAKVVIAARREQEGARVVEQIEVAGGEAHFIKTDVSNEADVDAMVRQTVGRFGRLDYAFNNAGVGGGGGPIHESESADWDRIVSINLKGVWLCMKYEIAFMREQGFGAIVNNSSSAGLAGYAENAIYAASKFGVTGLTMSAAVQYADQGIRKNAVSPGWTLTPMVEEPGSAESEGDSQALDETPQKRIAAPEEIAEAALWLCSDAASFVTGVALPVDGGLLAQ